MGSLTLSKLPEALNKEPKKIIFVFVVADADAVVYI